MKLRGMSRGAAFAACVSAIALAGAIAEAAPPERAQPEPDITIHKRSGRQKSGVRCAAPHVNRGVERTAGSTGAAAMAPAAAGAGGSIEIPVAFHVVYTDRQGQVVGNAPLSRIQNQIAALNASFAGTGYSFVLESVDRTLNSKWFSGCYSYATEWEMKASLAVEPATTLNIYSCQPRGDILGFAYYPSSYPEESMWHGVVLHHQTLPGGAFSDYNEGDTGVHEVGHYLGLYHTFEGGCTVTGDHVADTPAEASPAYECDASRDTCAAPGLDPIQNFMDYTPDACMYEFTGGQDQLMDEMVALHKPSLGAGPGCGDGTCTADERCSCAADCGSPPSSESLCSNGIDDDCDGQSDCGDANCSATPACSSCEGPGSSCSTDAECCSKRCKGKPGKRVCN